MCILVILSAGGPQCWMIGSEKLFLLACPPNHCLEAFSSFLQKRICHSAFRKQSGEGSWGSRCSACRLQLSSLDLALCLSSPQGSISQPQHWWTLELDVPALWKAVLCTVGCLADPWPLTTRCQKHPEHQQISSDLDKYQPRQVGYEIVPAWEPKPYNVPGLPRASFSSYRILGSCRSKSRGGCLGPWDMEGKAEI